MKSKKQHKKLSEFQNFRLNVFDTVKDQMYGEKELKKFGTSKAVKRWERKARLFDENRRSERKQQREEEQQTAIAVDVRQCGHWDLCDQEPFLNEPYCTFKLKRPVKLKDIEKRLLKNMACRSCEKVVVQKATGRREPPKIPEPKTRECENCGEDFEPKNSNHIYCCVDCRKEANGFSNRVPSRNCEGCGQSFSPRSSNHVYCSAECRRATNGSGGYGQGGNRGNHVPNSTPVGYDPFRQRW